MALSPSKWSTGSVSSDKNFTSASQIADRVAAIRDNRGLTDHQHNDYWVNRITSGKATLGDARTAITNKAQGSPKTVKAGKKKKGKPPLLDLTPAQLRSLVSGRRSASTDFATRLANLNANEQRGLASFRTRMSELAREFSLMRDEGMRELGGRGQASQPMFGGRFLSELRDDEGARAGELELAKAQLISQTDLDEQRAQAERDALLAELDALEAAYRTDVERIMGNV